MYRDDLEAAQARADAAEQDLARARAGRETDRAKVAALERELASARRELARARPSGAATPAAERPTESPSARRTPWLPIAIGGVAAAAILGFVVFGVVTRKTRSPSHAEHVYRVAVPGGARLIVVEEYETHSAGDTISGSNGWALTELDATTGERLARVADAPGAQLVAATATELWFAAVGELGLHRRALATLAVDLTQAQWTARAGRGALTYERPLVDGGLLVQDAQAFTYRLDPSTGDVAPASAPPGAAYPTDLVDNVTTRDEVLYHDATGRRQHATWAGEGRAHLACSDAPAPTGAPTYLAPRSLELSDQAGYGVWLADPPSVIAVHRDSTAATAALLVSRVPCSGEAVWTVTLPAGELGGAGLADSALYLVDREERGATLVAIDVATGVERWRRRL